MLVSFSANGLRRLVAGLIVLRCAAACGAAPAWPALSAADLQYTAGQLDTSDGVVVLMRAISLDPSGGAETVVKFHQRLKVLTPEGVGATEKIDIEFTSNSAIRDLSARVVKADGQVIELDPQAFHTREIARAGRAALSITSFVFPDLEPGCIAEYRYRQRSWDPTTGIRLFLDDKFPVALVRLQVNNFSFEGYNTRMVWSKEVTPANTVSDRRGFHLFEATNLPPFVDEPCMPPPLNSRPLFTAFVSHGDTDAHWRFEGERLSDMVRDVIKPTKQLTKAAQSITSGATSPDEKIARLYEYCRTRIKNLSFEACGYTPEQIEDLKDNSTIADVYSHGYGTNWEINLLFASLLRALGTDCALALCNDRSTCLFDRELTMRSNLPDLLVALPAEDAWRYYDPGALYLPVQQLKWRNEQTTALVADRKSDRFIVTPASPPDHSSTTRVARLRLAADGTLEGEVEITQTGHTAAEARELFDVKSTEQRIELIETELRDRLPGAVMTDCAVDHVTDLNEPLRITYHVRVENYADVTGDRLFVQPAFFQKGIPPRFVAKTRKLAVYFEYYREERDEVTIELPEGYEPDVPSLPQALAAEAKFNYVPGIVFAEDGRKATYVRKFSHKLTLVPPESYASVKARFDYVHAQDGYTITLKRTAPPAAAPGS